MLLELAALALLVSIALFQGQQHASSQTVTSTIGFGPAISVALGNGFSLLPDAASYALGAFEGAELDSVAAPPVVLAGRRPSYTQRIHIYYYYVLGGLWRLFGLSWPVMRIFLVLALGLCTVLAYTILRQFMNRGFSVLAALWVVQSLLPYITHTREFLRTPFMFGAILLLVVALKRNRGSRSYLALAALFGLTLGVGIGFRSDMLIPLPAGMLVFALAPVARVRHPLLLRFGALALVFLCFQGAGWPVLRVAGGEGDPVAMQAVNGMSQGHIGGLGLSPGSYYLKYKKWDAMTAAVTTDYGRRVLGLPAPIPFESARYTASGNALLAEMLRLFPADFVTRAYGAVFQLLGGSLVFLLLAALALLRLRWTSPARAWAALLSVMAFLTVYSLQFESRHYFFLAIAPAILLGFWAEQVLCGARATFRTRRLSAGLETFFLPWQVLRARWRGAALFATVVVVSLALPLFFLQLYQKHLLRELRQTYARLPVQEVETKRVAGDTCTFYRLAKPLTQPDWFRLTVPNWRYRHSYWAWPVQYLVAEFELADHNLTFWPAYDNRMQNGMSCMSEWIRVMPPAGAGAGRVRCFFPVYECHAPAKLGPTALSSPLFDYTRFSGVVVPNALAPAFRGLYRCTDISELTLLPCMFLPERQGAFQPHCRLGRAQRAHFPPAPAQHEFKLNVGSSQARLRQLMDKDPDNPMGYLQNAERLRNHGGFTQALEMYRRAIDMAPFLYVAYMNADTALQGSADPAARAAFWRDVADKRPGIFYAHAMLARALQESGEVDGALAACQRAASLAPDNSELLTMLGDLYVLRGDPSHAQTAYEKAVAQSPGYPEYRAGLIKAEGLRGHLDAANRLHLVLRAQYPMFASLYDGAYYDMASEMARQGMTTQAKAAYRALLSRDFQPRGAHAPVTAAGDAHLFLGDLEAARAAYRRAINVRPGEFAPYAKLSETYLAREDLDGLLREWEATVDTLPRRALAHLSLGLARERLRDHDGALQAYRRARELNPLMARIHAALECALLKRGTNLLQAGAPEDALAHFQEAAKLNTTNAEAHVKAGEAQEALGQLEAARAAYRRAIDNVPVGYTAYDKLNSTYVDRGDLQGLLEEWEHAVAAHPGRALAHFCLGVARQRLHNLDGAIAAYRRARQLDPSGEGTRQCLVRALLMRGEKRLAAGKPEAALEDFREAAQHGRDNPAVYSRQGDALMALGRKEAAQDAYAQAQQLKSDAS